MDWRQPVAGMVMAILPTGLVVSAYRKEGHKEPHTHTEVVDLGNWNFDQRLSIVSGTIVQVHHWAAQVRLGGLESSGS